MGDVSVFISLTAKTTELAHSALPNSPVVEDRVRTKPALWLAARRTTSRALRWLADVTEPAADCTCAPSRNTVNA